MAEKISKLTENTLIPLSFVTVLVGGVFWLTTLHNNTTANAQEISEIKVSQAILLEKLTEKHTLMLDRLARIEGRLETIQHKGERK